MGIHRIGFCCLAVMFLGTTAFAQEKKEEKKSEEVRKGTVTGIVVAKDANWIEVKGDGEEKARRYGPQWKGGAPAAGGGFDKEIVAKIKDTPLKARVRIEWFFQERLRIEKLEILKSPDETK